MSPALLKPADAPETPEDDVQLSLRDHPMELRKATDDIKGQFESEIARIDLDQQPQKMIAPVPDAPNPAEAPKPASEAPANPADDPGAARAAARRAAAESQLKLIAPEGAVPRQPESPPAPASEPKA